MLSIQEKRELFMKPYEAHKEEIDARVNEGIEKYRKGYSRIRLTDEDGNPIVGKKVKITQKTHDFKYGANIFLLDEFDNEKDNAEYRRMFKEYFNLATVPFYWDTLEPEEGKPRYDKNSPKIYRRPAPDLCMDYCEENGITPKLHCLFYDNFVPTWLDKYSLEETKEKYEERFRQIAERYAGRMLEFEVTNELLYEAGWPHTSKISGTKELIPWAYSTARKYMTNETLVMNEGNPLPDVSWDKYRSKYYMMVENALLKGVPINKIGLQHHLFGAICAAKTEEEMDEALIKFDKALCDPMRIFTGLDIMAEFGLPLEITEVTVPTFGETEEAEEIQAELLKILYSTWFSHPAVNTVVYWNTADGYTYVNPNSTWNENRCIGGLFHHDLTPKKSAIMLKKLFDEIWHTDLELTTDKDGYIDFRGFFGEYIAETDDAGFEFGLHKAEDNCYEIVIQGNKSQNCHA